MIRISIVPRTISASLAVLCTLFSAGGVEASAPDCLSGPSPITAIDKGTQLGNGFYHFKGKVVCSLTLSDADSAKLKHGFGEYITSQPGFTLETSATPERSNGDWFFSGTVDSTKPYQTWITYNYNITGPGLTYVADSTKATGEGNGKYLKKETVILTAKPTGSNSFAGTRWTITFEREVQIDKPWIAPISAVWSGVQDSIHETVETFATEIQRIGDQ